MEKEKRKKKGVNDKVVVLIPCYNEELTIGKVVRDYRRVLPNARIYVYDNNSTDNTFLAAKDAGAIVKKERKQGKGNVIRSMLADIKADCYVMADGDDACPASKAKKMCELVLSKEADLVIGDRLSSDYFEKNDRLFHNFGNKIVRWLVNWIFDSRIHDVLSGYRAFSKSFAEQCNLRSEGYEIETEITMMALNKSFKVQELPINYKNREGSVSRLRTVMDGVKIIRTIFEFSRRYKK